MMKKKILMGAVISSILCIAVYFNIHSPQKVEIVRVLDGDTVETTTSKIRLVGIDCYETQNRQRSYKQAYENNLTMEQVVEKGKKSTEILTKLLNKYKGEVYFAETIGNKPDKYNRQLGTLYAGKINVNKYMLQKGGCLKYHYTPSSANNTEVPSPIDFIIWFGIFVVLAWYQQEHWNKYKGESKNFYALLSAYSLLNCVFLCYAIYLGFKIMGGWFILPLVLSPLAINCLLLKTEMLFYKLHYFKRFSIIGLFFIPLSIYQILGGLWYTMYLLTLLVCYTPQLITKIKK